MTPEFLLTALIVVLVPGTGVIYTLATALTRGRTAAVAAALGCTFGIVPAMLAAVLGLAALLHTSALAFQVVKFAGVAFLLYLAWTTLKDSGPLRIEQEETPRALWRVALGGTLINVLNPKLSIFFLAFLPQFLSGDAATATAEMLTLGGVFMALTFIVFVLYGLFAASARDRVLESPRAMIWARRAFAASFAGLGLKLAFERA
ncbi:LysE family translocator [Sinisalibacter aestuarii]|uniref:Lysine transporter LysE n=1 Tax=Sinisalibacter aestuarii TaxID=2949426 RepID=A0ABQ5LMF9_9RHOB|nr:LysE family translocator [Sinisalibacter aestuarii]GKY86204.1 lysine transporter LysE [Sinisalibacter aestuarii]